MENQSLPSKIIAYVVFFVLLIWFIFYLRSHWADFSVIRSAPAFYLVPLALTALAFLIIQGWIYRIIIEPFNIKLGFTEWFGLAVLATLGSTVFPFGGFGFRATYLKAKHDFPYRHFLSTLAAATAVELFTMSVAGLVGVALVYFRFHILNLIILSLYSVVFIVFGGLLLFRPKTPAFKNKILQKFANILDGFRILREDHGQMKKLFLAFFLYTLLLSIMFYLAFHAFGLKISPVGALIPASLSDFTIFISILPASLGFYEGAIAFSARLFGFSLSQGLFISALMRVANVSWIFILSPVFGYLLFKRKSK